jgi:hypothetical protein
MFDFTKETGDLAEMDAGKDSGVTLEANQVGELAFAEIGDSAHGSFSGYDIVALGGIPEPQRRNGVAKISGDIQNGSSADVPAGTQVRLRLTDYSHTDTIEQSDWFSVEDIELSDPAQQPTMEFSGTGAAEWAKTGRHIVMEVRNKRQSFNADYSNSSAQYPYVGGRESVQ